jgi:hypothetical protein
MSRTTGRVEDGKITLPPEVRLPEGARVLIEWDDEGVASPSPLEREPLTLEEVQRDIRWGLRRRGEA